MEPSANPLPVTDQRISMMRTQFADGTAGDPSRPLPEGEATYADGRITLPRPVAFVLGGGGSLGAIQVGQLQALHEYGIGPDLVVGTSIGSLNGAILADDPDSAADRLADVWPKVNERDVLPGGLRPTMTTFRPGRPYLATHDALGKLITRHLPGRTFADLAVMFGAVTFEATNNNILVFDDGPLLPALMASCSIPGVFPPVKFGSRLLYDGGMAANVPIRQAVEMGARSIVVLDCMFPGTVYREPTNMQSAILYSVVTLLRQQVFGDLAAATARMPVVYLPGPRRIPPLGQLAVLDFRFTDDLIADAYQATKDYLDAARIATRPGVYWPPLHRPA